jgi:methionyl-tRNA formyltransferase
MSCLRIVFMGTAELACASLRALHRNPDFQVIAVVTQPDRPKGRDLKITPSPVKEAAVSLHLPLFQPARARDTGFVENIRNLNPDLAVVAAYGQILPPAVLDIPRFGCLNVHTSLLPKYRGAAPIQWAILNDEIETGVTLMKMDPGLDTGPIVATVRTQITADDDAPKLQDRLAEMGANLLGQTIPEYVAGGVEPHPQPAEGASYARKITREDGRIDWSQPARLIWNRVRGLIPWPGAFSWWPIGPKPRLLKIWGAQLEAGAVGKPGEVISADSTGILVQCGEGRLRLQSLQLEGARRMEAQQFVAGHALPIGTLLS